jgi:hypothetical protein
LPTSRFSPTRWRLRSSTSEADSWKVGTSSSRAPVQAPSAGAHTRRGRPTALQSRAPPPRGLRSSSHIRRRSDGRAACLVPQLEPVARSRELVERRFAQPLAEHVSVPLLGVAVDATVPQPLTAWSRHLRGRARLREGGLTPSRSQVEIGGRRTSFRPASPSLATPPQRCHEAGGAAARAQLGPGALDRALA